MNLTDRNGWPRNLRTKTELGTFVGLQLQDERIGRQRLSRRVLEERERWPLELDIDLAVSLA